MKNSYSILLYSISIQLVFTGLCYAQDNVLALKAPATAVVIDGNNKEWGDSLSYYNAETKIHYTIANDKENLYLVLKTADTELQGNILNSGVTFTTDTKGRKKSSFVVTFPTGQESRRRGSKPTLEENLLKAQYIALRKIKVDGFKDINDDEIPASNGYGIKVAINFDAQGNMIYEEAIPLDLFEAKDMAKNDWAFNIKINGATRNTPPSGPGGATGITSAIVSVPAGNSAGAGRSGGMNANARKGGRLDDAVIDRQSPSLVEANSLEFWGKFNLAK